ncbi:hypothetical protein BSKO_11973 [Bryopsis sp. KO-2023]|nr:hypothetical protein BSKO_11973 [Bryopsis sp. KO-2023]
MTRAALLQSHGARRWSLCVLPVVVLLAVWATFSIVNRPWNETPHTGYVTTLFKRLNSTCQSKGTTSPPLGSDRTKSSGLGSPDVIQEMTDITVRVQSVLDSLNKNEFKDPKDAQVKQVMELYTRLHGFLGTNRLVPFDLDFGRSRGVTIGREVLMKTLVPYIKNGSFLKGPRCMEWDILYMKNFLDVCTEPYNFQYPKTHCGGKQGKFLEKHGLGFCGDVHTADQAIPANFMDSVLATQVFEHLHDPFTAIKQVYRILKPGGVLLWTAPFISVFHAVPDDFFRYTIRGAAHLIETAGFCIKEAKGMSSSFLALSELMGMSADDFSEETLKMDSDDIAPLFVMVIAEKPVTGEKCKSQNVPKAGDLDRFRKSWQNVRGHHA